MENEMATRQTVEDICKLRDEGLDEYKRALYHLGRAKTILESVQGASYPFMDLDRGDCYGIETDKVQGQVLTKATQKADAAIWYRIFHVVGLANLMSESDQQNFWKETRENPPLITVETIRATVAQWAASGDDVFVRGLVEVFSRLDKKYCVNSAFRVGPRAVLSYTVKFWSNKWSWYSSSFRRSDAYVRDLERVFYVLENRKMPEQHLYGIWGDSDTVETDYISMKGYKNGNLHITFKRLDLVEKVNKLIAQHFGQVIPHEQRKGKRS